MRKHVHEKTAIGTKAKKFMDEGALVPDELIVNLLQEEVKKFTKDSIL